MIGLGAALVAGSVLVYFFRHDIEEPRRYLMALATLGLFFAPMSEKPLRFGLGLLGVAVTAWSAQIAGTGRGGFPLWFACSAVAAALVVRGGARATHYYLPEAGIETGRVLQRSIRTQLQISVALFLGGYVLDRWWGAALVALSAAFFVRYVLLQSKHLGIVAVPLSIESTMVPSQRWVVLVLFVLVGATRLPKVLVGEDQGPLLVTSALLLVTAALVFVLSLTRTGWPRSFTRRASFAAGVLLAIGATAVLVELESWDRARFRVFASLCIAFLVVLPFLKERTKLFAGSPRFSALVPSASFAVMMSPVTAIGRGTSWSSTTVFLFAFSVLMIVYYLLVGLRAKARGTMYLAVSLTLVLSLFLSGGGDRGLQVFLVSVGFVLYAVDRFERVWREARARERISDP